MANISKWPKVWLNLLLKPEETAATLKKEKPEFMDGILSLMLSALLISFVMFLLIVAIGIIGGNAMAIIPGLFILVGTPAAAGILLLIATILLKASSLILGGKGSISEECGILGVVGGAVMLIFTAFYAVFGSLAFVSMFLFGFSGNNPFLSIAFVYLFMGFGYLLLMPALNQLIAFLFDLLAEIEKVSIYRAGAIYGLVFGIAGFLYMMLASAIMFLMGLAF